MSNCGAFSLSTINFILLFLATELNCVVMSTHGYQFAANMAICLVYGVCISVS